MPYLDHALGPLDRELGDVGVFVGRAIEGRRDDLALQQPAAHVGDLFGPFVDEQNEQDHIGIVDLDRPAICFMIVVLPALGGDTIMPRWPMPIGEMRSMIARRHVGRVVGDLHAQLLIGEQRGQVFEARTTGRLVGRPAVDRIDAQQRRVLLVATAGRDAPVM